MEAQIRKLDRCTGCKSTHTRRYATPEKVHPSTLVPSGFVRHQYRICLTCERKFRVLIEVDASGDVVEQRKGQTQ